MRGVTLEWEYRRLLLTASRMGRLCRYRLKMIPEGELPDFNWRESFEAYTKALQAASKHAQSMAKSKAPELSDEQYAAELVAIGLDHVRTMAVPELERVLRERGLSVVPLEGN